MSQVQTTNADDDQQYFGLPEILRILGRRWRWVVGTIVIITGLVLGLTLQQEP